LGGPVRQLTRNWSQDVDPAWSPDGSLLAFASDRSGDYEIYTIRADGTHLRRLTHDPSDDRQPSWSPDGSQIVFSNGRPVGARERKEKREGYVIRHLYLMWADGSHLRRLTHGTTVDQTPAWSPDGRTILFAAIDAPLPRLESIRPSGGRPHWIGETGLDPDWSPKGDAIAFVHVWYPDDYDEDGPWEEELAVRRFNGSGSSSLGDHGAARWSPDGTLLATADGAVLDRGLVRRRIPVGQVSWQPLCTRSGNGLDNVLRGRPTPDVICGLRGKDTLIASAAGHDRLFGGAGSDRIEARNDGHFDVVGCGPGTDTVLADRRDLVGVDCERVLR
jgi:dipeptidyl aminopeptidase/acylaminoacyl peptidase